MPSRGSLKRKVYSAFGFLVESEIEIPGLAAVHSNSPSDVRVFFGRVPDKIAEPYETAFRKEYSAREAKLFISPNLMFYIGNGETIIIQASDEVPEDKITAFLLDAPFVVLLIQRGFFVLHGTSAMVDGLSVSFLGRSGEGKSALMHELWKRGNTIITDDICAIKIEENRPMIYPGIFRLSVWRDTIEDQGEIDQRYRKVREEINKYFIDFSDSANAYPVPAERFFFINESNGDRFSAKEVKGCEKIKTLLSVLLHHQISEQILGKGKMFGMCTQIMGAVTAASIYKNSDLLSVSEFADAVLSELSR